VIKDSDYVAPGCEVVVRWEPLKFCSAPTVAGYAAMNGGWMALCQEHVHPHEKYVHSRGDITSGIARDMQRNGSRG
jgi:hypothetical protein